MFLSVGAERTRLHSHTWCTFYTRRTDALTGGASPNIRKASVSLFVHVETSVVRSGFWGTTLSAGRSEASVSLYTFASVRVLAAGMRLPKSHWLFSPVSTWIKHSHPAMDAVPPRHFWVKKKHPQQCSNHQEHILFCLRSLAAAGRNTFGVLFFHIYFRCLSIKRKVTSIE